MELGFLNTSKKPIREDHRIDSTPAQDMNSEDIDYVDNKGGNRFRHKY